MEQKIAELKLLQRKMRAYSHAMGILYYDSVTVAPAGTAEGRGNTLGVLAEVEHHLLVNEETGALLEDLLAHKEQLDFQTLREVESLKEAYDRQCKVPVEEVVAYQQLLNQAQAVWHKAKLENDYASFAPYLEDIFKTNLKLAGYYDDGKKPYDVLLDQYEKGFTQELLDSYFSNLRDGLVPLIQHVTKSKTEIDDSFLYLDYPLEQQRAFSDYLMEVLQLDRNHCGIGETEHPFTINFNRHDVRITTHYLKNNLGSSMYSVIHEGGHAIYELGMGDNLDGSVLEGGTSMGIHESQSRFYENIIGRSLPFIYAVFPKIQEFFPEQLGNVTAEQFYLAVNKSTPSLIRTEADELTYSLHVMVRYEVEKMMLDGAVTAAELPALWNRLYKEYLGVDVPNDTQGILQDSHWSGGSIGYFPSYSLGSAYGAQMLHAMEQELDVWGDVAKGDLTAIKAWLTEKIYRHGSSLKPMEVLQNCCNEAFNPQYYIDYLNRKYREIYK